MSFNLTREAKELMIMAGGKYALAVKDAQEDI
jgi:hypothetical protein